MPPRIPKIVCTKSGGLTSPAVEKVGEIVEVPNVVAFEFEPHAMRFAKLAQDVLDVGVGVAEDVITGAFEIGFFPIEPIFLDPGFDRIAPKIHRTHVERAHLWFRSHRRREALLQRHPLATARRDIDDGVGALFDLRQELHEDIGIWRRAAIVWSSGMQVEDRRACLGRAKRRLGDLSGVSGR